MNKGGLRPFQRIARLYQDCNPRRYAMMDDSPFRQTVAEFELTHTSQWFEVLWPMTLTTTPNDSEVKKFVKQRSRIYGEEIVCFGLSIAS